MADYEKALSLIESGGGSGGGIEYIGKYTGSNPESGTVQTYGDTVTFELTGSGTIESGATFVMALAKFSGPSGGELVVSSVNGYYSEGKFYASVGVDNVTEAAVQYNDGAFDVTYEVFKIAGGDDPR